MAAALGGMVSRPRTPEAPQDRAGARPDPAPSPDAGAQQAAPERAGAEPDESQYRRTGTGYVTSDGVELVRTVVMVTPDERRRLKMMALEAGVSPSDYVRRALGFLDG